MSPNLWNLLLALLLTSLAFVPAASADATVALPCDAGAAAPSDDVDAEASVGAPPGALTCLDLSAAGCVPGDGVVVNILVACVTGAGAAATSGLGLAGSALALGTGYTVATVTEAGVFGGAIVDFAQCAALPPGCEDGDPPAPPAQAQQALADGDPFVTFGMEVVDFVQCAALPPGCDPQPPVPSPPGEATLHVGPATLQADA